MGLMTRSSADCRRRVRGGKTNSLCREKKSLLLFSTSATSMHFSHVVHYLGWRKENTMSKVHRFWSDAVVNYFHRFG